MVKPRALKAGDTVGLIAPSSYIFDLWRIEEVAPRLAALGLKTKLGANVRARRGFLAGTEEQRLADLHAMFADPEVAAVFCLGGGYGTERLLDRIDYGLIRKNPKIFLGYSDITGLHLAFGKLARLVTFHGPVAMASLPPWTLEGFKKALFAPAPIGVVENPPEDDPLSPHFPRHTIVPGKARGQTVGGNLTLISTTMGTPYEIETRGKILIMEDVGEAPYRIDRMILQLGLAGKLAAGGGHRVGNVHGLRDLDELELRALPLDVRGARRPARQARQAGHGRARLRPHAGKVHDPARRRGGARRDGEDVHDPRVGDDAGLTPTADRARGRPTRRGPRAARGA